MHLRRKFPSIFSWGPCNEDPSLRDTPNLSLKDFKFVPLVFVTLGVGT